MAKVVQLAVNRTFWNACKHKNHPAQLTCSPADCGGTEFNIFKLKDKIFFQCLKCKGEYKWVGK